ncbi:porin [Achromobacter pestifer]
MCIHPRTLAIAVLSLLTRSALAAPDITFFGVIDEYIGITSGSVAGVNAGDTGAAALNSGGLTTSQYGLRGREDLGDGLSAAFEVSGFFRADSGAMGRSDALGPPTFLKADPMFSRSSWVGLTSQDWGGVRLGNTIAPIFLNSITTNAFDDSMVFSPLNLTTTVGGPQSGGTAWTNQLQYESPQWRGMRAMVGYGFPQADGGRNVGGRLSYNDEYLTLGAIYQDVNRPPVTFADGTTLSATRTWQLAIAYRFEWMTLYGHLGGILDRGTRDASEHQRHQLWEVSAAIPFGSGKFLLGMASRKAADLVGMVPATAPGGNAGRRVISLGYDYLLSKRTDLYAIVMRDQTDTRTLPTGATIRAHGNNIAFGMRHRF